MTRAVLLAGAAGALAAPALVDLLLGLRAPRRRGGRVAVGLLVRLGRGFGARAPRGLGQRIGASGLDVTVHDVMAVKVGAALAGLAVALALLPAAPGRTGITLLVAAPAAGFLAPDVWIRRRTRARAGAMEAELASPGLIAGLLDHPLSVWLVGMAVLLQVIAIAAVARLARVR